MNFSTFVLSIICMFSLSLNSIPGKSEVPVEQQLTALLRAKVLGQLTVQPWKRENNLRNLLADNQAEITIRITGYSEKLYADGSQKRTTTYDINYFRRFMAYDTCYLVVAEYLPPESAIPVKYRRMLLQQTPGCHARIVNIDTDAEEYVADYRPLLHHFVSHLTNHETETLTLVRSLHLQRNDDPAFQSENPLLSAAFLQYLGFTTIRSRNNNYRHALLIDTVYWLRQCVQNQSKLTHLPDDQETVL